MEREAAEEWEGRRMSEAESMDTGALVEWVGVEMGDQEWRLNMDAGKV